MTDWVAHLRGPLLRGDGDALFPVTKRGTGPDGGFISAGLERFGWSTSEPVRRIFRAAFRSAGLPYFPPHSFRHTLASLGEMVCQTPEQFKSWSQNLGHDDVLTTFTSYGQVPAHRQAELIRAAHEPRAMAVNPDQIATLGSLLAELKIRTPQGTPDQTGGA
ncbi:MAG: hypothetical protein U1E64_12685 [Sphingomonadaceae bacterium]